MTALPKTHYVPACAVKVGGKDVLRDHHLAVTQAQVDLGLKEKGRFSFTVAQAFDMERREFVAGSRRLNLLEVFALGAKTTVAIGYGDPGALQPLIEGTISEISTSFPESGGPEITVAGYDGIFAMDVGKPTRSWRDARDSDVVRELATNAGLKPDVIQTSPKHPQIEQKEMSDFALLKRLTERNKDFVFYVVGGALRFGPEATDASPVVRLVWGEDLLSFRPTANLARQVQRVEVHGWDAMRKAAIVGIARRGDEPGREAGRKSGGERFGGLSAAATTLQVRRPVHSQEEAESRAKALLKQRAEDFVKGDGECFGLPQLRPDRNVHLDGLGRLFSRPYYLESTTHVFDTNGYRTRFKIKEPTA